MYGHHDPRGKVRLNGVSVNRIIGEHGIKFLVPRVNNRFRIGTIGTGYQKKEGVAKKNEKNEQGAGLFCSKKASYTKRSEKRMPYHAPKVQKQAP
jgi:hypothetical protein